MVTTPASRAPGLIRPSREDISNLSVSASGSDWAME